MKKLLRAYLDASMLLRKYRRNALDVAEAENYGEKVCQIIAAHRWRQMNGFAPPSSCSSGLPVTSRW